MSEETKAIEEVAKTTGKAIDAGRELGGFLAKYIGGPLEQAIGIIEDKFKYMRWERQQRLISRADEFMKQQGLVKPTRNVPLQIAIPLFQGGSLEENDELQDRWANLLVNAANVSSNVEIRRAFISILEDITALDAHILETIYSLPYTHNKNVEIWTKYLPDTALTEKPDGDDLRPPKRVAVSIGNLERLGLLNSAMFESGIDCSNCMYRTALGYEFYRAVTPAR